MTSSKQRNERLVMLTLIGAVGLNYPLLSLFSGGGLVFGVPVLYLYLFVLWAILILLAGLIIEVRLQRQGGTAAPTENKDRHA